MQQAARGASLQAQTVEQSPPPPSPRQLCTWLNTILPPAFTCTKSDAAQCSRPRPDNKGKVHRAPAGFRCCCCVTHATPPVKDQHAPGPILARSREGLPPGDRVSCSQRHRLSCYPPVAAGVSRGQAHGHRWSLRGPGVARGVPSDASHPSVRPTEMRLLASAESLARITDQ